MSIDEIKKLLKLDVLVIGSEETLKAIKNNELEKVFLASNAPENLKGDINQYASIANIQVEMLSIPNDELGTICKKPFSITCIGQKKVGQKKKY